MVRRRAVTQHLRLSFAAVFGILVTVAGMSTKASQTVGVRAARSARQALHIAGAAAICAVALCACVRKVSIAPVKPFQKPVAMPQRELPALVILAYHRVTPHATNHMVVSPDLLRRQLLAVQQHGYTVITPDEWVAAVQGQLAAPPKPVMLTFDDAWRDQYAYALPILEELGMRAVFYAYTATIGSPDTMSWDDLRELARRGHVIGCHSATHSDLARPFRFEDSARYAQRLQREIAGARAVMEQELGFPVAHFCYPYGFYNTNVIALVRAAGYRTAMTVNPSANAAMTPLLQLGRMIVAPWTDAEALVQQMATRPLAVTATPGDGAMPLEATTRVVARLPELAEPLTAVRVKWNWRWVEAEWNPATRTVTLPFTAPLTAGIYTAQVHAWDARSNHYVSAWLFQQTAAARAAETSHAYAQLHGR